MDKAILLLLLNVCREYTRADEGWDQMDAMREALAAGVVQRGDHGVLEPTLLGGLAASAALVAFRGALDGAQRPPGGQGATGTGS